MGVRRQRWLDIGLAAAAFAALVADGSVAQGHQLGPVAYVLAAATAVPLAWRRSAPLPALLAIEVGAVGCVAVFDASSSALAVAIVGLFTVGLLGGRRRALIAGGVSGVVLVVATLAVEHSVEPTGGALRLLLVLAALATGDTVRSRRALRASAAAQAMREAEALEELNRQRVANERLRIARDLHDTLAHALVAINVRAGVAAFLGKSQDPTAALLQIKNLSAEALNDLRGTLRILREADEAAPVVPVLDLTGLPSLVDKIHAGGIAVQLRQEVHGVVVPSPVSQVAYRIVQEALTNVLRHAGASAVLVLVAVVEDFLEVRVSDDGRGGPEAVEGHGLRGMSERATAVGGQVVAGPRDGGGWQVQALLPLTQRWDR
jgi:signal transduction histidine kinase